MMSAHLIVYPKKKHTCFNERIKDILHTNVNKQNTTITMRPITIKTINNPILPYDTMSSSKNNNNNDKNDIDNEEKNLKINNIITNLPHLDEGEIFYQPSKPSRNFDYSYLVHLDGRLKLFTQEEVRIFT